jgi:hypothetical protein
MEGMVFANYRHGLVVRAKGYHDYARELVATEDDTIDVVLEPRPPAPSPPPARVPTRREPSGPARSKQSTTASELVETTL